MAERKPFPRGSAGPRRRFSLLCGREPTLSPGGATCEHVRFRILEHGPGGWLLPVTALLRRIDP